MALINFISSLAASLSRRKGKEIIRKEERPETFQVRLTIIETTNYFQDSLVKEGVMVRQPKVGEPFRLMNFGMDNFIHSTTKVTAVLDKHTFTTANSKYRIDFLK